jgi:hypothetical protein
MRHRIQQSAQLDKPTTSFRRVAASFKSDYFLLSFVWLLVHFLPFYWLAEGGYYHWDVVQVRKLLDYGFWERGGAILASGFYVGMVSDPASHNYVNHSYPIFWVYSFLYWLFGKGGLYFLSGLSGYLGCLLTFRFLAGVFPRKTALFATLLVITSHATVEFAMNTDVVAQGSIIWPLTALAVLRLQRLGSSATWRDAWLPSLAVFLVGQVTWFALTAVPALLLLTVPTERRFRDILKNPASVPGLIPIVTGAIASLFVFIGQILVYSPSLLQNVQYLSVQAGTDASFFESRLSKLPVLFLRMFLAAPALWLLVGIGTTQVTRLTFQRRLVLIMMFQFLVFFLVMLAIPRLLFLNQHGFRYNVFPCAVVACATLVYFHASWMRLVAVLVAIGGLLFCYSKLHDYRASCASQTLGNWVACNTRTNETVYTNIRYQSPPIASWDGEFLQNAAVVADRIIYSGIASLADLKNSESLHGREQPFATFLLEESQPYKSDLLEYLQSRGQPTSTNLPVPPESIAVFKTARQSLWKMMGKSAPVYTLGQTQTTNDSRRFNFTLYPLSAPSP